MMLSLRSRPLPVPFWFVPVFSGWTWKLNREMILGSGDGGVQKLPGGIAPVLFRDRYGCMGEFRSPGHMRGEDIVSSQTGDHGKRQGKIPGGLRCSCTADIGIPVCGAAGTWIPGLFGAVSSGTASHLPFPHHPSRKDQPHREKPRHFRRSRSPPGSSGNRDRSEPSRQRSRCRYEDPIPVVSGGQEYLVVIPALVPVSPLSVYCAFSQFPEFSDIFGRLQTTLAAGIRIAIVLGIFPYLGAALSPGTF